MGSEMCIRDRISDQYQHGVGRTGDHLLTITESGMDIGTPAQLHPCLLYTSDAADERSSVDLGGRRIIKTKTIELIQRTR